MPNGMDMQVTMFAIVALPKLHLTLGRPLPSSTSTSEALTTHQPPTSFIVGSSAIDCGGGAQNLESGDKGRPGVTPTPNEGSSSWRGAPAAVRCSSDRARAPQHRIPRNQRPDCGYLTPSGALQVHHASFFVPHCSPRLAVPHLASSLLQSASFQRPSRKLRHVRGTCPMGVRRRPLIPGLLSRPCGVTMSISSLSHIHSPYTLPPCEYTTPPGRTRFRHPQHQRHTYLHYLPPGHSRGVSSRAQD